VTNDAARNENAKMIMSDTANALPATLRNQLWISYQHSPRVGGEVGGYYSSPTTECVFFFLFLGGWGGCNCSQESTGSDKLCH
jgi:hypothetical protein